SDIYSLGVIIYQMLTGDTPFKGDMFQLILKHTQTPPEPIREKRREIPAAVESLIMSALEKKPSDRPASAASFAIALRANAEGELPVLREAIDLYRRNLAAFMRIALRVYLPFTLLLAPLIGLASASVSSSVSVPATFILIPLLLFQIANAIDTAAFSLVIKQLRVSPNSPIQIERIMSEVVKNLRALALTTAKGFL